MRPVSGGLFHVERADNAGVYTMKKLAIAAVIAFAATTAFADDATKMSNSDMTMMKKCQGMSESAMKGDKQCMAMMKTHPDMMKGATSGMTGPVGSDSGMKK